MAIESPSRSRRDRSGRAARSGRRVNLRGGGFLRARTRPAARDGGMLRDREAVQRERDEERLDEEDPPARSRRSRRSGSWTSVIVMSLLLLLVLFVMAACGPAGAAHGPLVIRGGTLIDGTGADPVEDAVVVVRGDTIAAVGPAGEVDVPSGARELDASGRWIVPGYADAHVHYSQTGWFDGRPDAADVRAAHPYPEVVAALEEEPERFYRSYLCSGVTSTFDVGGYPWTLDLQARGDRETDAVRVRAAGPLLSTIDFWLNLPAQRQFVHMASDSVVRRTVRSHAEQGAAAVKVWYITSSSWSSADSTRYSQRVHAAGAAADSAGLPLIVHATGLWEAKDAIRAGAEVLVHSVFDEPVDGEFLRMARESGVVYTPTLTVIEGYPNAYLGKSAEAMPYPARCVDEETKTAFGRGLPSGQRPEWARGDTGAGERAAGSAARDEADGATDGGGPERYAEVLASAPAPVRPELRRSLDNLRRVHGAGVTVATGTDAGNPGTAHGPSIFREMELMAAAGMSPMDVLVASTRNVVRAMGRSGELGTLEAGRLADLVILDADPLADVANAAAVSTVIKGGEIVRESDDGPESDEGRESDDGGEGS